ncbi:response regulator [Aquabacter sp. CN5-332]|uniref:response regulator n=1 Tax=Aquabacter sp. CN5-332 TaxID=3156608 RepID=UPI0032B3E16D
MNQHVPNILIAEDSPTQAAQIVQFLKQLGYSVSAARSGVEAYDLAVAAPPDILISDIVMPGMDGYELCRRLKATPGLEEVPVILVTSLSQPQDVLAGLEAGADNFIIKPYDEEVLRSRITYLLKNRSLRRAEKGGDDIEVELGGERHHITARKQQILDLLISTYAQAVHLFSALDQGRQELSQSYEVLHALYEITEGLNRCRTPADVALTSVLRSLGVPGVRDAWIYLRDDDGLRLTAQKHAGRGAPDDPFPPELPTEEEPEGHDEPMVRLADERLSGPGGSRHHASMRLRVGARTIGYFHLAGAEPAISGEVALRTLAGIASQISIALERAILHTGLENEVRKRTQRLTEEVEERRQATETITAIFNASPVALISLDAQLNVATWNRTAHEVFKSDGQSVVGRPWSALFTAPPRELREAISAIRSGIEVTTLEMDAIVASGTELTIHIAGEPLIEAGGVFRGAVLAIDDISERRQVEAQLRQAQKMEAVGNLTGGIAHDFNNLLTTIIGNLDLALIKLEDEATRPFLDVAMRASLRGAELTKKLLAFARKQPLEPRPLEVSAMANDLRIMLEGTLGSNIAITLSVASDVPDVYADPIQLEAAIMNLAINARDAMPDGGRLTIEVAVCDPDEGVNGDARSVVFSVSDTGVGIAPEHLERIFEPFFTTKEMGKGTGLGLAMVYGFANQSGGALNVESALGAGTTFRLFLPGLYGAPCPSEEESASEGPWVHEPRSILLVEGNPEVRRTIRATLVGLGHKVHDVANAEQALLTYDTGARFDLLLSDVGLPGQMNGWDLAGVFSARRASGRILLMSAAPEPPSGEEAPSPLKILRKPFRMEELRDAIAAIF